MEKIRAFEKSITSDNVLFFDMDGTLIDTNLANYLSYIKAIRNVTKCETEIIYDTNNRFNRSVLRKIIPNLTESEYEMIIIQKEIYYKEFLQETKLIEFISEILIKYYNTNSTVLVTNCRKDRALLTLGYFGLIDKFSHSFFRQQPINENKINKYANALSLLSISPDSVLVFENEDSEINDAIFAGIPEQNILNLK